jgi:hypothetical protein
MDKFINHYLAHNLNFLLTADFRIPTHTHTDTCVHLYINISFNHNTPLVKRLSAHLHTQYLRMNIFLTLFLGMYSNYILYSNMPTQ